MLKLIRAFIFLCGFCLSLLAQDGNDQIKSKEYQVIKPTTIEDARIAYNKGTVCMQQKDLVNAEIYLKKAIGLDPNYVDAYDHLGIVYRMKGQFEAAIGMYKKSIEIAPENLIAYNNLALIYKLQRKYQEAYDIYIKMISIDPSDPEGYFGSGVLLYLSKQYKDSRENIDEAIRLYTLQKSDFLADAVYYQCFNLYNLSEFEELSKIIDYAIANFPEDKRLKAVKEQCDKNPTTNSNL